MILLYPYPYQILDFTIAVIILYILGIPFYALYNGLRSPLLQVQMRKLERGLIIGSIVLGTFLFAGLGISLIKIRQVNVQMGCRYATPELPEGEPFLITRVDTGSVMYEAGLREDDRVQMASVNDLYALLINNQGSEVSFEVKRGREIITIRLVVPELDIWQFKLMPFARF